MHKNIGKNWEISGPNGLSKCPEPVEMDFGHFWELFFDDFSTIFWTNIFRKNGPHMAPLAQVPG